MKNYNEILKELREDKDMNQSELGKILNATQRQISTYETGRNEPPFETLKKYALYFNVSTDYILGLTTNPSPNWKIENQNAKNITNISGNFKGNINMN